MELNRRSLLAAGGILAALILIVVIVVLVGGDDSDGETSEPGPTTTVASTTSTTTPATTTVPVGPLAPLTGVPVGDRVELLEQPAIMVKISNNDSNSLAALIGIEQADVVIEERIEDRATRFATIFHTNLPTEVGAVRSGRPADIELMANLGTPILVYSGAHPVVLRDIVNFAADGGVVQVVHDGTNTNMYRDDQNFRRPDNLFVDLEFILDKFGADAGVAQPIFEYVDEEHPQSANSVVGDAFTVNGRDTVSYVWDPSRGYVRVQDGVVHITREEVPLVTHNLVVMETVYTRSTYDSRNVDAHTTGSGPVSVLIDGRRWEGTWERPTAADPYRFLDADGQPILLEPGNTWLTLVPPDSYEFEVESDIASLVLGTEG